MAQKSQLRCDIRAGFATAFRDWWLKNNVHLKKIAGDLAFSVATINSWELGRRFPKGRNFELLANCPGVPWLGAQSQYSLARAAFSKFGPSESNFLWFQAMVSTPALRRSRNWLLIVFFVFLMPFG